MIKALMFILLVHVLILAQGNEGTISKISDSYTNLIFGIRDELPIMKVNIENNSKTVYCLPFNIHLVEGIKFLRYYKFGLKLGLILGSDQIPDDFNPGYDLGFFFTTNLFASNFIGIVGIDFMYSSNGHDGSHGASFIKHVSDNNGITFYCIGFGYETSTNFSIDVIYYIPNKNNFGSDKITYYSEVQQSYDKLIYGVINIGFQYSFIF